MSATEIILLVLLLGVLTVAWSVITSLTHQRDDWRRLATGFAINVRGLDAWPVVEHTLLDDVEVLTTSVARQTPPGRRVRDQHYTVLPIPPNVAVIGRHAALDRWSTDAAALLARYDALLEPEGCER